MTLTPWGDTDELRVRKLSPGPGASREAVVRSQRDRLFAAMVSAVAEDGYQETSVADVLERAGVSRRAFYEHFANLEECFLAALDEIVEQTFTAVGAAYSRDAPWDEQLRAALSTFLDLVAAQPTAARAVFVEIYAAGPAAASRGALAAGRFEELVADAFERSPERAGMPIEVVRAIVGGVRKLVHSRLRRGEAERIPELLPEIMEWALSYETPNEPLRSRRTRAPRGDEPRFAPSEPADRIALATAQTVAEKGYPNTRIIDIVTRAHTSRRTFYEHYDSKEEAFLAAYDAGQQYVVEGARAAYEMPADWPRQVKAAIEEAISLLASEPAIAQLELVEVFAAGPRALERGGDTLGIHQALLDAGAQARPDAPELTAESIGGAIQQLLYDQLTTRGPDRLVEAAPALVFIALAPFIGADAAAEVANERPRRKKPAPPSEPVAGATA